MKKIKHSKVKNTGILFELLVRQITSDALNNVAESVAGNLIRKYFNKKSPLSIELSLYQTLMTEKISNNDRAVALVEAVTKTHSKLNKSLLSREKYNLIKEIRDAWDIEKFFTSRVSDYKALASIYKLFEYRMEDNPSKFVDNKFNIVEHITNKKTSLNESTETVEIIKEDKEIRELAYKLMIEKFNSKYNKTLDNKQKKLLETYITNVSNTTTLKEYISGEAIKLATEIKKLSTHIKDKTTSIKINESINILKELTKGKVVRDEEVLSLLKYYNLVNEIKKLTGVK